ncbi:MAG: methyl-accepting chemotaxis protein [Ruminococcus sp.]|jgi:methyl-accepting chemotaxis protein|nr:methyl-accepting chemotaxis protein [Ruminococcus sp.]
MNNKQSIKSRILRPVLTLIILLILIMVVVISVISGRTTTDFVDQLVSSEVEQYGAQLKTINERSYVTVEMLREQIYNSVETAENPRDNITNLLLAALGANDASGGYWAAFIPNAVGNDAEFIGTDTADETGRFLPCVSPDSGGNPVISPLVGVDDPATEFYWGAANSGKPYITEPFEYDYGSGPVTVYSICLPMFEGGGTSGKLIGVVGADIMLTETEQLMSGAAILEDGYVFLLSTGGLVVTSPTSDYVLGPYSDIDYLNAVSEQIKDAAQNGTNWSGTVDGKMLYLQAVKTGDVPSNWVMGGTVAQSEANSSTVLLTVIIVTFGVVIIILTALVIIGIISNTLKPLAGIVDAADKIAEGDVASVHLKEYDSDTHNEIEILENSFIAMTKGIEEQTELLSAVAEGDYSVSLKERSEKDTMNHAINSMIFAMNSMFIEIKTASANVSAGASNIADVANQLAMGSTEQAATVEEISASVAEITVKTKHNTERSDSAAVLANDINVTVGKGEAQMEEMTAAMNSINEASRSIGTVIKSIDDIAFQTNILALNAAVEAARAGEAGKGFAVVAGEVRNLASKSAEAAKETNTLIENSIKKAEQGGKIVVETAQSLSEIKDGMSKAAALVNEIAEASREQSIAISQINDAVAQVAEVVQSNSAGSEECASSSAALNSDVESLNDIITHFKLND